MYSLLKQRWFVLTAVCILALGILAGCGDNTPTDMGSDDPAYNGDNEQPNGEPDPNGPLEEINWNSLRARDFLGGESFKLEWWQQVDGQESSGRLAVTLAEALGEYTLTYEGILGEYEFSNSDIFVWDSGVFATLAENVDHYLSNYQKRLWDESWVPILGYFEPMLNYVGDKAAIDEMEAEAAGYKTFAGQDGLLFTFFQEGQLVYELCISPDVPVNLYSYSYDTFSGNEFRVELVEYSN